MVFTDKGIYEIQNFIRSGNGTYPSYVSFGSDIDIIVGSELIADIGSEFLRKSVSWTQTGDNSKYSIQLNSTEANGSNINRIMLLNNSDIGSGNLFTLNESIIGEKNNSFNVQVEGEIIITRK